ncbi:MAG TPA: DUF6279 family lipoprotein [Usitatibacter sp.]|nr:DUF6279 family lipoprotein [Usitatibacter sp.]
MVTRTLPKVVLFLAAALLLGACATMTRLAYSNAALAYRNLPPMLTWMVDEYVELSGGQKDWVRDRVDRLMEWHRTRELPEYRRFLERVLAETNEPFTVAEIDAAYRDLRRHYRLLVEQALPDIADFMMQLDSVQVAQMEKKFATDNRKFVRESVKGTPDERRERRVKRFVQHLEGWLGDVTREQRELVERFYADIPDLVEERLADRKVRHLETLEMIRARGKREETIARLRRMLLQPDTWRRPEYLRKLEDRDQRFFQMFAALSATFTPAQRAHLQRRIRGYMQDITTLTAAKAGGNG